MGAFQRFVFDGRRTCVRSSGGAGERNLSSSLGLDDGVTLGKSLPSFGLLARHL